MAVGAAIAGAVFSAVGTIASVIGQQKQAKAASKRAKDAAAARQRAEALQTRRDNIQASRQRRRSAAEARRFRGSAANQAALSGAGGAIGAQGSTVPGVQGNIQSQLNFNNAFINQVTSLNAGIRSAFGQAADIANRPITAGSGFGAFGALAGAAGGFISNNSSAIGNFFSPSPSKLVSSSYSASNQRMATRSYGYGDG